MEDRVRHYFHESNFCHLFWRAWERSLGPVWWKEDHFFLEIDPCMFRMSQDWSQKKSAGHKSDLPSVKLRPSVKLNSALLLAVDEVPNLPLSDWMRRNKTSWLKLRVDLWAYQIIIEVWPPKRVSDKPQMTSYCPPNDRPRNPLWLTNNPIDDPQMTPTF